MDHIFTRVLKRNKISKVKDNESSTLHTIFGSDESMFGKMNIKYTNPILHIFNMRCICLMYSVLI